MFVVALRSAFCKAKAWFKREREAKTGPCGENERGSLCELSTFVQGG